MIIQDLFTYFEKLVNAKLEKRKMTNYYYSLIREQINHEKVPLVQVRSLYNILTKEKGCKFTYQYFNRLVEQKWNVVNEGRHKYLVVSSEREDFCSW